MHRFNIARELTERARDEGELGLAGILVWMRFMATRQLTWNKNYNVKPREISAAQDRLTDLLQQIFKDQPHNREIVRLIMSTVGRGGQGDVGQRIRDEILVIQRNNDCKGGMMEEWHQKLHNNTSPDDVVICQALLDYVKSDFNIDVYWNTLNSNGVTKERLASYDRKIGSEPRFRHDQKGGLIRDLTAYLRTLKGLLESRFELRPTLLKPHGRLKDIIFLDLALDSTVRTAIERGYEELNTAQPSISIFTEEMIRAGSAACTSWQVISPVEVHGYVAVVDELATVQNKVYDRQTILVAKKVKGEEEIPDCVVAVFTPDMPDVLSHVSVRARNSKVCFATCFDPNILNDLRSKEGKALSIRPTSSDIVYTESESNEVMEGSATQSYGDGTSPGITLKKKHFGGRYAISADEFSNELVGAKSRNIAYLRGKVPSWVRVPVSVALPFGVFESVLSEHMNKVWASKWNERAYFSTRKAKIDHNDLCMAVLVQEIISADYAFVIHTTNPSSGDSSEIYAEVVKGLGETLVGAYPGRAMSFVTKKSDLNSPKILGYPSKPIGLFIKRSIIFRSDSNGEDLEGYAGAGLYDSVPMDEEEEVVLDYSSDPLVMDHNFRHSMLSKIAQAGNAIEELYGFPQDVEGVVKDGEIYVVQTRPQM